jgi:amidase
MPFFKQELLEKSEARPGLDSSEYVEALKKLLTSRKIIDDLMNLDQLDAISAPTNGFACCIDLINGDYRTGPSFASPAAISGYPHITVPMGTVMNLPVGISFIGGAYKEPDLLKMAYAFEQASKKRVSPAFINAPIPV